MYNHHRWSDCETSVYLYWPVLNRLKLPTSANCTLSHRNIDSNHMKRKTDVNKKLIRSKNVAPWGILHERKLLMALTLFMRNKNSSRLAIFAAKKAHLTVNTTVLIIYDVKNVTIFTTCASFVHYPQHFAYSVQWPLQIKVGLRSVITVKNLSAIINFQTPYN